MCGKHVPPRQLQACLAGQGAGDVGSGEDDGGSAEDSTEEEDDGMAYRIKGGIGDRACSWPCMLPVLVDPDIRFLISKRHSVTFSARRVPA